MSIETLIEKWTTESYPPEQVSEAELQSVEAFFKVQLPSDYRATILRAGAPSLSIRLLDTLVDGKILLPGLSDFQVPASIIERTIGWREAGMPKNLIAFASDESGNSFCFDIEELTARPEGARVWFFDHDFDTVEEFAPSFAAFVEIYADIEPLE